MIFRFLLALVLAWLGYLIYWLTIEIFDFDPRLQRVVFQQIKIKDLIVLPGFILTGFFILPHFCYRYNYRPWLAALGGMISIYMGGVIHQLMIFWVKSYNSPKSLGDEFIGFNDEIRNAILSNIFVTPLIFIPLGALFGWVAHFLYHELGHDSWQNPARTSTAFTYRERLLSGLYFAGIATLSWVYFLPGPVLISAIAMGGFLGGFFIAPAVLVPQKFLTLRSMVAGLLSTLGSALFAALILTVLIGEQFNLLSTFSWDRFYTYWGNFNFYSVEIWIRALGIMSFTGAALTLPFSFIGVPAAMLLSYLLYRQRNGEGFFCLWAENLPKPCINFQARLYLSLYMTFAGYISIGLVTALTDSLIYPELGFTLPPFENTDLIWLSTYFLSSFLLLPARLSGDNYNAGQAIYGGMLVFFLGSLFQGSYSLIAASAHYYALLATEGSGSGLGVGSGSDFQLQALLSQRLPSLLIRPALTIPIGGILCLLAYGFIYPRRPTFWLDETQAAQKLEKIHHILSALRFQISTLRFRLFLGIYWGSLGYLSFIVIIILWAVKTVPEVGIQHLLNINQIGIFVPHALMGSLVLPWFITTPKADEQRAIYGGMFCFAVTIFGVHFLNLLPRFLDVVDQEGLTSRATSLGLLYLSGAVINAVVAGLLGGLFGKYAQKIFKKPQKPLVPQFGY